MARIVAWRRGRAVMELPDKVRAGQRSPGPEAQLTGVAPAVVLPSRSPLSGQTEVVPDQRSRSFLAVSGLKTRITR